MWKPTSRTAACWRRSRNTARFSAARTRTIASRSIAACRESSWARFARGSTDQTSHQRPELPRTATNGINGYRPGERQWPRVRQRSRQWPRQRHALRNGAVDRRSRPKIRAWRSSTSHRSARISHRSIQRHRPRARNRIRHARRRSRAYSLAAPIDWPKSPRKSLKLGRRVVCVAGDVTNPQPFDSARWRRPATTRRPRYSDQQRWRRRPRPIC